MRRKAEEKAKTMNKKWFGEEKHWYNQYYFVYTVLFAITFFLCFFWFFRLDKSFIWNPDGLSIHYNFLAYFGEYLREFVSNIIQGKFRLPMWDYSLGYGSDIIIGNFSRVGDPLNYLSVFVSRENTELLHNVLSVLRIYLAGISFSVYCFKHRQKSYATLLGALTYAFCGVVLWAGVRHSYFINPMIYFPLLLLGAEKILHGKNPVLFVVMIFLSAIGSFYFFYMMSILAVVFIAVQFFTEKHTSVIKEFFQKLGVFVIYYLIGVALAAVLFIPIVLAYMNNARLNSEATENLLFRNLSYYLEFIPRWITQGSEYGEATGYTPFALICVVLMFLVKRKEFKRLKTLFVILTIFLLIPFFGYAFNGFGYVIDRWVFGYSFMVAYIVTSMVPELKEICRQTLAKTVIFGIVVGYGILSIFIQGLSTATFLAGFGMLALTGMFLFFVLPSLEKKKRGETWGKLALLILVIISLAVNGDFRFSPIKENYIAEYDDAGEAYETLTTSSASTVEALEDYGTYRIDEADAVKNTSVAQSYAGLSFYTSLLDYHIDDFHKLLSINNAPAAQVYNFKGVDRRAYLEALLGVKYYTTSKSDTKIPYGFTELTYWPGYEEADNTVYLNENVMPFAFTYDSYITEEEFETYPLEKRQEIVMQSIVLDKDVESIELESSEEDLMFRSEKVPYEVVESEGIKIDGNKIIVTKPRALLTLTFKGLENSETYLKLENLRYSMLTDEIDDTEELSNYDNYLKQEEKFWSTDITTSRIYVYRDQYSASYYFRNENDRLYSGIDDFFMNMGYSDQPLTWCRICFSQAGEYTFDELSVVCQPMDELGNLVQDRTEDILDDLAVIDNTIAGRIELSKDKILYLSVPYNSGWTAMVDGEETELLSGNMMGMALPLSAGEHEIVLRYRTPGLFIGGFITTLTIGILVIIIVVQKIVKRRWKK